VIDRRWPGLLLVVALASCTSSGVASVPSSSVPTTVGSGATAASSSSAESSSSSASSSSSSTSTTVAATIVPAGGFADVAAAATLGPVPADAHVNGAASDSPVLYRDGCHLTVPEVVPKLCVFGDTASTTTIVVTGDSHAAAWFGAFEEAATAHHWRLVMVTKSGCPTADVTVYRSDPNVRNKPYLECNTWRKNAIEFIRNLHPSLVVFPMLSRRAAIGFKKPALGAWQAGLERSISGVEGPGVKVLVLGDTPLTKGQQVPACVAAHLKDVSVCANTREKAVLTERLAMEQAAAAARGALFVDVSDWICSSTVCPVVIAGDVVYRDEHHLTDRFSRYRSPQIAAAVQLALAGADAH
jgi:hypothetical protein